MGLQADVYARWEAGGRKIGHDVSLEGWHENPAHQIKEVGRAIGICEQALENKHLLELIHQMGKFLESGEGELMKDRAVTRMHGTHQDSERGAECGTIRAAIAASGPDCNEWYKNNASHTHNSILKFVRKCHETKSDCGISCVKAGHWYYSALNSPDYTSLPGLSKCAKVGKPIW